MRHELDGHSAKSGNLKKLQSDYITNTIDAGKLGFNNVFTVRLPKIKKHILKVNTKEQVKELIE